MRDVRGLDFKTGWYEEYLDASWDRTPWIANGVLLDDAGPLITALDVDAVITSNPDLVDRLTTERSMRAVGGEADLTVLMLDGESLGATVRFNTELAESDEYAAARLAGSLEEHQGLAILPDSAASRAAQQEITSTDFDATVSSLENEPERRSWRISTDRAGLLVVSDAYYPGRTATVDGQPAEILGTNIAFRGIVVPAGDYVVEMRYQPSSVRNGGVVTLIATALALAVLAASFAPMSGRGAD